MPQGKPGETPKEIVRHAGITERRFRDWRERGLVPRPMARPSRGHARGRAAFYPEGTAELCRAIAEKMEEVYRLADAALLLWFEGYPLTSYVRKRLAEGFEKMDHQHQEYLEQWHKSLEDEEVELDSSHPVRRAQFGRPDRRWLSDLLPPGERSTLAYVFLEAVEGSVVPEAFSSEAAEMDDDPVAVVRQTVAPFLETFPAEIRDLVDDEQELLAFAPDFIARYNLPHFREVLLDMSDDELEELRDQALSAAERWSKEEASYEEVTANLFVKLFVFECLEIPVIRLIDHLLAQDDDDVQEFGRQWRDLLLGGDPLA